MKIVTGMLKKEKLLTTSMLLGAAAAIIAAAFGAFAKQAETMPERIFRLHILANSDSKEDQALKYRLRDYLLEDFTEIFDGCQNAEEAKAAAKAHTAEIAEKARLFLDAEGSEMPVSVSVENIFFTTRSYGNLTVPAGNYDALRVVIGEGKGKNWWCVMFPPLCLPAVTDTADISYGKTAEPMLFDVCRLGRFTAEQSRVIEDGGEVRFSFALFEWLSGFFAA